MNRRKFSVIVMLVAAILLSGNLMSPVTVAAAETETSAAIVDPYVIYVPVTASKMKTLFGVQAPQNGDIIKNNSKITATYTQGEETKTKEIDSVDGYYFGGWYLGTGENTGAIKYHSHKDAVDNNATVYAKFVPSYMLNVKVQNGSNISDSSIVKPGTWQTDAGVPEKTNIRMISAVDSTRYSEVGFHVYVGDRKVSKRTESVYNKTVYDSIVAGKTSKTAQDMFGLPGKLMVANFTKIPKSAWGTSIFIRPYWITFDGIEVRGNGRYIHVEDGIEKYISVPVNIQGSSADYAAGSLSVKYDNTKLDYIGYKGDDLQLGVVKAHDTQNGIINCVAVQSTDTNIKDVTPNLEAAVLQKEDFSDADIFKIRNMYVTLRFKLKSGAEVDDYLTFNIQNMDFCNRDEQAVSVNVWDVKY